MSDSGVEGGRQFKKIPAHIAVIMDGNGRWAQQRGLIRFKGHEEGKKSVHDLVRNCGDLGIQELTLYAFSTENWRRPKREVDYLMNLLEKYLIAERADLMEKGVKVKAIGRLEQLPRKVRNALDETIKLSGKNKNIIMRLALNYGGRQELLDAFRAIADRILEGEIAPDQIDEKLLRQHLYDNEMTDPDLIIRTGGEMRVSNFLLWQLSYAELWITDVCWPDFRRENLEEALAAYAGRQRRFGGVTSSAGGKS